MKNNQKVSFNIISNAGIAKSKYMEALKEAKNKNFEKANELIKEGDNLFINAHKIHADLITKMANKEDINLDLLLIHAEDQLMSTETIKLLIEELIELYKVI
ncbi:PTS lactose/cellobiose transporter subunit IIA [Gemella sp. GH3]|uniref:PTS lactose/cellobiose transporter subunit IIA n=1 Tax=unclassified Gemella TaxID=2624949 RepID=UPI0015D02E41|nr:MULTISPECIES: PTS lactose/cellobiose transporter subunit IIA [unclassified Gemella]MBF0714065.1 PTS lactose/cellobiose transporter subunit IIA [Gemella sp. GH3.1]NYS51017.1 PTS lactose/cellobiose transporter subunit IIA [Gemella sp. GH3]